MNILKWIVEHNLWIPIVSIYYMLYNYVGYRNNTEDTSTWVYTMIVMSVFQFWVLISKYSTNLVRDGMIYDLIILLSFPLTMWLVGNFEGLKSSQLIGIGMIVGGFVLFKLEM